MYLYGSVRWAGTEGHGDKRIFCACQSHNQFFSSSSNFGRFPGEDFLNRLIRTLFVEGLIWVKAGYWKILPYMRQDLALFGLRRSITIFFTIEKYSEAGCSTIKKRVIAYFPQI